MPRLVDLGIEKIYAIFLSTIFFWAIIALVVMNNFLDQQSKYGELINKSGMQRMLSQKILYLTPLAANNDTQALKNLNNAFTRMESNHRFLLDNIPSESVEHLYYTSPYNVHQRTIHFLTTAKMSAQTKVPMRQTVDSNEALLSVLDHVVNVLQSEYEHNFKKTLWIEIIIWGLALSSIAFEAFYLVLPAIREIKNAREQAELASRAKTTFLINMSHEIRTPLNGMMGFLELLEKKEADSKNRQYLNVVFESAKRLEYVVNEILEYSKLISSEFVVNNTVYDLKSSVENTLKACEPTASAKKLQYLYQVTDLPALAYSDEEKVQTIMHHIIDNAIKFTPENGMVKIKAAYDHQTHSFRFAVKDNGIGIAQENIDFIFEPFNQIDGSISRQHEGIGLGLSIIKTMVQGMNGTLKVTSEEKGGTTVVVELPIELGKNR